VRERLGALGDWTADAMEESLREMAEARGIGAGKIFQPMRVALTGLAVSPGIFDVLVALGRDRSLARLDAALGALAAA
jgi:glutamyl-tRNA synthetase